MLKFADCDISNMALWKAGGNIELSHKNDPHHFDTDIAWTTSITKPVDIPKSKIRQFVFYPKNESKEAVQKSWVLVSVI